MLLNSINNLSAQQAYKIESRKTNLNFRSSSANSLERVPEEDTLEKKDSNRGKKFTIGTIATIAGLALADAIFLKGKFRKKLFGKAEKVSEEVAEEASSSAAKSEAKRGFRNDAFKERQKAKRSANVRKAMENKKAQYQKRLRKDLASKGKLDFELNVGEDRIVVKKGEIAECFNAQNNKWSINKDTDPNYVEKIKNSIEEKINEIIKQNEAETRALNKIKAEARKNAENVAKSEQKPSRGFDNDTFKETLKAKRSANVRKAMENKKSQYQNKVRKDLALKGKLDFELKVGEDRIVVKKGEIAECYNAQNNKWNINKDTDPNYVEKIKNSIEEKINEIIKQNKV